MSTSTPSSSSSLIRSAPEKALSSIQQASNLLTHQQIPTIPDLTTTTQSKLFRPFPKSLAIARLKSNLFALFIQWFLEFVFTPYKALRRGVVWFGDEVLQKRVGGEKSYAGLGVSGLETLLLVILLWNCLEAYMSIRYPTAIQPPAAKGLQITPSRMSSPLTRAYIPSSASQTPTNPRSTPLPASALQSSQLARFSTPTNQATPSRISQASQPHRNSPLSASTAKILNLPSRDTPSNGLFYDPDSTASPSRVGRGQAQQSSQVQQTQSHNRSQSATDDFVLVERDEKEWVDNVWKGVRGKGGRIHI